MCMFGENNCLLHVSASLSSDNRFFCSATSSPLVRSPLAVSIALLRFKVRPKHLLYIPNLSLADLASLFTLRPSQLEA